MEKIKQLETGKILHVQTLMHEAKRDQLKISTGESNIKDAIIIAVDYYLEAK